MRLACCILLVLILGISLLGVTGSKIDFTLGTTPGNASSGKVRLWANSTTGNLECLTSAGLNCINFTSTGSQVTFGGSQTQAFAIGDSIAANSGVTNVYGTDGGFAQMLSNAMGWYDTDVGLSGAQAADMIGPVWSRTVNLTDNNFGLLGYNDMRFWGTNATAQQQYQDTVTGLMATLAIPTASRQWGNARSSQTGSWTASPVGPGFGLYSSTAGSTLTFSVTGTTLYIETIEIAGGGSFAVSVDSVNQGTFSDNQWSVNGNTITFGPLLVRITGLSNTTHSVVITVQAGGGNVYIEWVTAFTSVGSTWPRVWAGNTLKMNATGYSIGAPFNVGSDTAVSQFNTKLSTAVNTLAGDGLRVTYVDASAAYNPNTQIWTDNIHPNQSGHISIANAFISAIGAVTGNGNLMIPAQASTAGSTIAYFDARGVLFAGPPQNPVPQCVLGGIGPPATVVLGQMCYFTDASSSTTCTTGGGISKSLCIWNGSAWAKP